MFKRPSKRVKITGHQGPVSIPEDSYLHTITHPGPPNFYEPVKHPVYHQESYLKTLKQNYKDYDLPFKDPDLPKYVPVVKQEPNKEPKLLYGDQVQVTLRVLKNGSVRVGRKGREDRKKEKSEAGGRSEMRWQVREEKEEWSLSLEKVAKVCQTDTIDLSCFHLKTSQLLPTDVVKAVKLVSCTIFNLARPGYSPTLLWNYIEIFGFGNYSSLIDSSCLVTSMSNIST